MIEVMIKTVSITTVTNFDFVISNYYFCHNNSKCARVVTKLLHIRNIHFTRFIKEAELCELSF